MLDVVTIPDDVILPVELRHHQVGVILEADAAVLSVRDLLCVRGRLLLHLAWEAAGSGGSGVGRGRGREMAPVTRSGREREREREGTEEGWR